MQQFNKIIMKKSLEEQIIEARNLLGKTVKCSGICYKVGSFLVACHLEDCRSFICQDYFKKHGASVMLKSENKIAQIPLANVEKVNDEIIMGNTTVILEEKYFVIGGHKYYKNTIRHACIFLDGVKDHSGEQIKGIKLGDRFFILSELLFLKPFATI